MYQIVKNVITSGRYELNDMLAKIDTIWLQGDLTDDQRSELVALAQANADPANSYATLQEQINQAFEQIAALDTRITALEAGEDPEPAPEPEEWPEWVQPTGVHDAHYNGYKCTFNGKKYICTALEGVACVWSPAVYPDYWEEVPG